MSIIIAAGLCAVMFCGVLLKPVDKRGIVCWTLSALTLALSGAVLIGTNQGYTPDLRIIVPALMAAGAVLAICFAVELAAPSKRLRGGKIEYDIRRSEDALNLVLAIVTSVLAAAAGLSGILLPEELGGALLIPALGISLRQVSYSLYRIRKDSLAPKSNNQLKEEITQKLGGTSSKL
ncbi:MAG: hypothetical protein ACI4KM_07460 [Oscillospiraceae bacterium]